MDLTKENMQALGQRNPVHFFCFLVEGKNIYNLKKEEKKIPIISLVRVSMIEARNAKEKECSMQLGLWLETGFVSSCLLSTLVCCDVVESDQDSVEKSARRLPDPWRHRSSRVSSG